MEKGSACQGHHLMLWVLQLVFLHCWVESQAPLSSLLRGIHGMNRESFEPLGTTTTTFSWEYQGSLQRESEMLRQVMPGGTSLSYSAFLENRYRESVQMQSAG